MRRTSAMTESGVVRLLVFGIVGVIGEELFGRADNRKMNPDLGKASVQSIGDERVGDVFAVPRQEEVHPVDSGCGNVEGVATGHTGQDAAGNQASGEGLNWLGEVEERDVGKELQGSDALTISPSAASSSTSCEVNRLNCCRWLSHHSRVSSCRASCSRSRDGRET